MHVRTAAGSGFLEPVCIWRLCEAHDLNVRFMPMGCEGLYVRRKRLIIVCSKRPLPRRVFTGAHELGHHVFGHGSTLDVVPESMAATDDELLVDMFAGYLMMPPLAIRHAFVQRGLDPAKAGPLDLYSIACSFGVGYTTLIDHMSLSLGLLDFDRAQNLKRTSPKELREGLVGPNASSHMVIVDEFWSLPTIDLEVGDILLLPEGSAVSGDVVRLGEVESRCEATATSPGIGQALLPSGPRFIRVSRKHYEGIIRYRHLEDPDFEHREVPDAY